MIIVQNLFKQFRLYRKPSDRLKEIIWRRSFHRDFQALCDISFSVAAGETLGIVGPNGAGKTTLLKVLTGILMADSGTVTVQGRITGLLELGTGFNAEFSGIDNIFFNGSWLGLSRSQIAARLEAVVAFTELGGFIYEPVKTYSTGMVMRLAFAVAIHADPQCFVVDEALSVGDAYFQQKCIERIRAFKAGGGAIVFVSHDMNAVKRLCDRALLMDKGRVIEAGEPNRIIETYNYLIARMAQGDQLPAPQSSEYGNHKVRIIGVTMRNQQSQPAEILTSGEPAFIQVHLQARQAVETHVGFLIRDRFGQDIFGTNTFHLHQKLHLNADRSYLITFAFECFNLGPGKYTLTVAAHSSDTHIQDCYHWIDRALAFEVVQGGSFTFVGLARLEPVVAVEHYQKGTQ